MSEVTTTAAATGGEEGKVGVLYENLIDLDLRKGIRSDDPALGHRCQLFDSPSLLFDKHWVGSDQVRIELVTTKEKQAVHAAQAFSQKFDQAGLVGEVSVESTSQKPHRNFPEGCSAVVISNIKIKPPVKPDPLLQLIGVTLWIEPNKIDKLEEKDRWKVMEGGGEGPKATQAADEIRVKILEEMKRIESDQKLVLQTLKRLQKFTQLPAKQSKGADVFRYLQQKRTQLKILLRYCHGIKKVFMCSVCGRICQVLGKLPSDATVLDKLKLPKSKHALLDRLRLQKEGKIGGKPSSTSKPDEKEKDGSMKEKIKAKIDELERGTGGK
mmetsp:Transcript_24685/g.59408  ORF Transcript_24685/g.59408 Transcript_24685/m.59408 type:complete len:326 (-) Transcript_24685:170-1147(-)